MDLVGLLLIVLVLLFGSFYAAWICWSVLREARSLREESGGNAFGVRAATWGQHGITLVFASIFLTVGASMCVSIVQGNSQQRAVKELRLLLVGESTDTDIAWGHDGNQGALHYSGSASKRHVSGASLAYIKFGDSDLKQFVDQYPSIEWLILSGTQIDDRALQLLAQRESLSALVLTDTAITDNGLVALQGHQQIQELDLTRTAVTDRTLAIVRSMPALRHLSLRQTVVTDKGIKELEGNTVLQTLNLQRTQITDASVPSLATLKNLHILKFRGSGLSSQGIARLQDALPKCEVSLGPN